MCSLPAVLISIPFFQPNVTPEYYFGTDFRLARYLPTDMSYHFYSSFGPQDPLASFAPGDVFPRQDGDTASNPKLPLGLAFWSDTEWLWSRRKVIPKLW